MPKFFTEDIAGQRGILRGGDVKHLTRVLRLGPGDAVTLCDGAGFDYDCQIETVEEGQVICTVLEKRPCPAEPDLDLTVYMALPKQDKMQLVVQKCVELGCREIVPVTSEWCVSRPDPKSLQNKTERWQKIAWEAAKQCGRGVLPTVSTCLPFARAVEEMAGKDLPLLFYEKGGRPIGELLAQAQAAGPVRSCGLLVGSEGGLTPEEVALAEGRGVGIASLGPRILRCETAPLAAAAVVMYWTGNL